MLKRIAILSMTAILSTSVYAHPPQGHKGGIMPILKQLDLSIEQRQDIRQIVQQARQDKQLFSADRQDTRAQMREQVQADNFDEEAVTALLTERSEQGEDRALAKATRYHQVWHVLSDDQQVEFENLMAERKPRRPEELGLRMLKKLNLSEAQQAEVEQIMLDNAELREEAKIAKQSFQDEQKKLIKADEFDQTAWKSLFDEQVSKRVEYGVAQSKARNQVWNLLTDEQQAQAQELMQRERRKPRGRAHMGKI